MNYLIVGQGIAGTNLAFTLLERGNSVTIADNPQEFSSSKVAAGLFNPITGRKMSKIWLADSLFPYLHNFYPKLEQKLEAKFFHTKPIYVPFDSVEKQNNWLGASADSKYEGFIGNFVGDKYNSLLKNHFGGMTLAQSGFVDTQAYLSASAQFFKKENILLETEVITSDLILKPDSTGNSVEWKGQEFDKVIFCDGPQNTENSYFGFLDYRRVKGEIMLIELEAEESFEHIINRGCWLIPAGENRYKVGSTYDFAQLDSTPTEKGKQQIEEKLQDLISVPYKILDHSLVSTHNITKLGFSTEWVQKEFPSRHF
jgi:glycine/D-amino acid oxidase-like deaminating enzyme